MGVFRRDEDSDPKEAMDGVDNLLLDSTERGIDRVRERRVDALLPHRAAPADLDAAHRSVPTSKRSFPKTTGKSINLHGDELVPRFARVAQFATNAHARR